jgi:hypothetical protein
MQRLFLLIGLLMINTAQAQSNLPACNGSFKAPCFAEYRFPNGHRYVGEWSNEEFHGQGSFFMSNGDTYVGGFQYGKNHGQGTYTWPDGKKYVGQFVNGIKSGQGTFTWPNGNRYVGQWSGDRNNGQGTLFYPDGSKYVGQWRDAKQNGRGIYYKPDGSISEDGLWSDNIFVQATNPPPPPPVYANEENSRSEYKARPQPPKILPPRVTADKGEGNQESKHTKCVRLGLVPGSVDYRQCVQ